MNKILPVLALAALTGLASARARNERAEIESMYKSMSKAFASRDVKAYTACWTPAIRWFPPRGASTTTLTKGRANLLHDLRVEFAGHERVAQDFAFTHFNTDPEKATVDLAVSVTHLGVGAGSRTTSERHHWLKAGGRWWLSRIEALD